MYMPHTIRLNDALRRMRQLSECNVPFSISFIGYSEQQRMSSGLKIVQRALIRTGYRDDQSQIANSLLAYTNMEDERPRQCYIALLMTFNEHKIIP